MQTDESERNRGIDASQDTRFTQTPDQPVGGAPVNSVESVATGTVGLEARSLDCDADPVPSLQAADINQQAKVRATLVPGHPDFLMSYATLPGMAAYRDRIVGSLYVKALATCLRVPQEIDYALKQVSFQVCNELQSRRQVPFHFTTGMHKVIRLKTQHF